MKNVLLRVRVEKKFKSQCFKSIPMLQIMHIYPANDSQLGDTTVVITLSPWLAEGQKY